MPKTMLAEALAYAAKGWPVFPCNPKSDPPDAVRKKEKTPLVGRDKDANGKPIEGTGGVSKATTDHVQIRDWWTMWPNALIGVRLGIETGLWVVDLDPRGEPVADVEARLVEAVGPLPVGPRSETQSGGHHVWLRMPAGEVPKNSAKRIENVDWRAEGGYVILPPSRMSNGNAYKWIVSPEVADYPEATPALLDLVFKRGKFAPPKREVAKPTGRAPAPDRVRKYCEVALDRAVEKIRSTPKGQRNVELNNIALGIGHLVGAGGLTREMAWASLREAALSWGIGDDDKALKQGGTLDRALDDGARSPADLSHVGNQVARSRPEPVRDTREIPAHDPDTGEVYEGEAGPPVLPGDDSEWTGADYERGEPDDGDGERKFPFRCLGYNREAYYYFSSNKRQITALKAKEHTSLNLLQLADLNYWGEFIDVRGKLSAENWQQIANSLIQKCHHAGIFVETRVRGRGAWLDGKTVIVHTGDSARVSGDVVPLTDVPGRFIYEAESPWEFQFGSPANNREANELADICSRLTWMDKMSGALLAGWCVIAPVCGALKWRPHIWITGPSGSGKTTAVEEIAGRIVGPAAQRFDGNTSEAGIRQTMGYDARPIILDEAESEDAAQVARMQAILGLARVSSSGGTIAKGNQNGRAMNFVARSCFLFSSINTALKHHADESRVTKLILSKNTADDALEHYQGLMRDIERCFTPEYAGAMFSRTVANLSALNANTETFKTAAAMAFRNRRAADQIGPMLAGYYLCFSTGRISLAEAEGFIAKHKWADHLSLEASSDELRLFAYLMSRRIRLTVSGKAEEMSVGQAIEMAATGQDRYADYQQALGPRGIRADYQGITISNTADGIREYLRDTPWVNDWKRPLGMIDGAEPASATYFAPGLTTRGVWLPLGMLSE
jgi:hypothetical protein